MVARWIAVALVALLVLGYAVDRQLDDELLVAKSLYGCQKLPPANPGTPYNDERIACANGKTYSR